VRLGAHLLTERGSELRWDYGRAELPRDLAPAGEESLELRLRAPGEPGRYLIELDLVAEGHFWFEDAGGRVASIPLTVLAT